MGFNIGSVLSGLNIPSLNLGNIGSDILTEGKKLLGEVVKDSFTLSNQPGSTFASSMNLDVGGSSLSLPNPIGALANKLLSGADSELNKFGVNVDFKKVAQELFHLPTQSGGSVTVPSATSRAASGGLPASPTAAVASTRFANVTSAPMGLGGGGSGSVSSSNSVGTDLTSTANLTVGVGGGFTNSLNAIGNTEANVYSEIQSAMTQTPDAQGMITVNGQKVNATAYLAEMQQQMSQITEMMNTLSNIMSDAHQSKMNTINNIKG
jgi:hypothetical protein